MFTTFSASTCSSPALEQRVEAATPVSPSFPRTKRQQVSRACVWCRTYRIKCDTNFPCNNCKVKGRKCSDSKGKDEVRTYPLAIKEIEKLKQRVKELESQLKNPNADVELKVKDEPVTSVKLSLSLPVNLDPLRQHGGNKKYYNWDFVSTRTARSNQQCYGTSSAYYFIGQMTSYLDAALQQRQSAVQLTSVSRYLASPVSPSRNEFVRRFSQPDQLEEHHMSQSQEECLVDLYFSSHHWIYPVLDEAEFRTYHRSLWETLDAQRKPSAPVDIVLAICMQYRAASTPQLYSTPSYWGSDGGDATIAGRWYYRRCQSLLTDELEGPSIQTFQCHLLSVIWLSNASFQNMAHSVMAMGIRIGVILGLHLEPPEGLPRPQKEFRKRLWWTLYTLEMKMGMELGRPLAVSISMVTCSIPDDAPATQGVADSMTSFNAQIIRLVLATRAIYITFHVKCADVLGKGEQKSLYQDPNTLETCAEFLLSKIDYLQSWVRQVPEALKTKRRDSGHPFSTDRSSLDVRPTTPSWLPRQRLFLELTYHNHSMSLYRPFISFNKKADACIPLTESNAISCVNHAITITNIVHQMLAETDLLNGWHETFQWQWNATLSLIGYILAYPVGPSTLAARKAISTAIVIFEILSPHFASAVSAANVTRDLSAKADLLINRFRTSLTLDHPGSSVPSLSPLSSMMDSNMMDYSADPDMTNSSLLSRLTEEENAMFQNTLTSSSGFAFSFDSFSSFNETSGDAGTVFDLLDFSDGSAF
ncbi:hypothetical protein BDV96DRAFT_145493 [Lophiotrema nucula]|uniref:Zn(2)-C6 fungal-type domain-containing protein n=1 Tax=Lophiotrema nucula TaxID=690887 RepID=A0A6A5Z0D2_9PLEO|nr:hypothetical protein BDV96DRAFT_145493 [Lophiotrema nucula]